MLLDLLAEARFERLLTVLADMPARPLAVILPRLAEELPAEQLRALVERLGSRLESPDAIADMAWRIGYASGDSRWAYSWLRERGTRRGSAEEGGGGRERVVAAGGGRWRAAMVRALTDTRLLSFT